MGDDRHDDLELEALIRRAQRGEAEAQEELLETIRPYIVHVARGFNDPARASRSTSDLVQEAELRVWRSLGQFRGEVDGNASAMFRTWLVQVIRRLAFDTHRGRSRRKRAAPGAVAVPIDARRSGTGLGGAGLDLEAEESSASAKLLAREREERVRTAIDEIGDDVDRDIVRAYFFEEVTLRELSTRHDLPYHTIRYRFRTSLKSIEQRLGSIRGD